MLFAAIDAGIVELVIGGAGIVLTIAGAALGAYVATVKTNGALKTDIVKLTAELCGVREWLSKVAAGDTAVNADHKAQLIQHEKRLDNQDHRLSTLEIEHAEQMGKGGCRAKC